MNWISTSSSLRNRKTPLNNIELKDKNISQEELNIEISMPHRSIKIIFALAIFLNIFSLSSLACSFADGYLPSTKYGLIKKTESIVLAEVVAKDGYNVEFKILNVLKGDFKSDVFNGVEVHTSCRDYSFEIQIESKLPPAIAQRLPKIKPKYLLFLNKHERYWKICEVATEAMNSPIFDADSSELIKTVRQFIRISSINNYENETRELRKLRVLTLGGKNAKVYPESLALNIDEELDSPTPDKTYEYLLKLYARLPEEKKRDVLWAFAWGKHKEAAAFFMNLFRRPIPLNYIGPISEYIVQTRNEDLLIRLGRNYPTLDKSVRWPLMWALIKTADKRHIDLMLPALRSANREEAGRLAEWFLRNPNNEATEIVRNLVGENYQEDSDLTFSLAGMGDIATIEWAKEFMNTSDKDRWKAYYAIAYSPLEAADTIAKSVIVGTNAEDLTHLIQGYGDSQNPNRFDRLRDVIESGSTDPKVRFWLKITLKEMAEEEGNGQAADLLKRLEK